MDKKVAIAPLSAGALYDICRGLADRLEDYGWNVYYNGTTIPAARFAELAADDDAIVALMEAFDASLAAYEEAAGEEWAY